MAVPELESGKATIWQYLSWSQGRHGWTLYTSIWQYLSWSQGRQGSKCYSSLYQREHSCSDTQPVCVCACVHVCVCERESVCVCERESVCV